MIRDLIIYPNKILKTKSEDVDVFDDKLFNLLDDMYETMISKKGVGIAAIQIGVPKNVFIISIPNTQETQETQDKKTLIEVINPKITMQEGEIIFKEGCLSVPGYFEEVKRSKTIKVEYFNRDAKKIRREISDIEAVVFQHELEHLMGYVFIERLSMLKRIKFEKEWEKKVSKPPNSL